MAYYKICIYAICKNESKYVEKWVRNMSEADYICVLDTGSTDNTLDELIRMQNVLESEKSNCKLIIDQKEITPWRFDVARNESLKLCPKDTDIFFCTDLDELLSPNWSKPLRDKWNPAVHDRAYYMYTWSHLENGNPGRVFVYDKIHAPGCIWKFPVHECICREKDLSVEFKRENALVLTNEIMLEHFPDKTKSRSSYLPLLELRAKEYPEDTWGLMYLAHEYNYRKLYNKSIEVLDNIISRKEYPKFTSVERSSCYLFRGDDNKALGNYGQAFSDYMKAIEIEPTLREPYLKMASLFTELKMYDSAISFAKKAIEKGIRHYSWIEKDYSWTYEPYDILSIASFYAGYKRDSLAYAYKAYSYDTNNKRLKDNVDVILSNMTEGEFLN